MGGRRALMGAGFLVVMVAVAGVAAPASSAVVAAGASGGGAVPGHASHVRPASTPAISVDEPVVYPVNALCNSLGLVIDSTATVDGSGFKRDHTATVSLSGKKKATALTDGTGAFQATFTDPSQPDGTYPVTAKTGSKSAATTLYSNGSACDTASGKERSLKWHVEGVGFDAGTEADVIVSGAVYESLTTNAKGAFNVHFHKACPGHGTFDTQFRGSFGGTVVTFGSGTLNCP
jgi:hypothetical protein